MKTILPILLLALTAASCKMTHAINIPSEHSSTGFTLTLVDGWVRTPNVIDPIVPSASYGDMSFFHEASGTIVLVSSMSKYVPEVAALNEVRGDINPHIKDLKVSVIYSIPEIDGAVGFDLINGDVLIRTVVVNNAKYTHMFQCIITSPPGQIAVSALFRSFNQ